MPPTFTLADVLEVLAQVKNQAFRFIGWDENEKIIASENMVIKVNEHTGTSEEYKPTGEEWFHAQFIEIS